MPDIDHPPTASQLIEAGRDHEAARRGVAEAATAHRDGSPAPHGGQMDPLTQLGQLAPAVGSVVAGIAPDQLDRPTPCAEFTVRGVLEHMIGGATMFAAAFRGEVPPEPDLRNPLQGFGPALTDLAAAISAPGALDRTVAAPFGDVPGETFARFVVLDGLVHGWDMAMATGQQYDPPAELVAAADAFARQALDPLRDGTTFADAVEPAEGATPIERLAAYTGRRP
ncbi:MAG: TIGR03086 family metal-binding protein [Acidimicrobiales bacterium]